MHDNVSPSATSRSMGGYKGEPPYSFKLCAMQFYFIGDVTYQMVKPTGVRFGSKPWSRKDGMMFWWITITVRGCPPRLFSDTNKWCGGTCWGSGNFERRHVSTVAATCLAICLQTATLRSEGTDAILLSAILLIGR